MSDEYRYRLIDHSAEELQRTSALLRAVFPSATHLTPRYLDWQYRLNAEGTAIGCNAYAGSQLVGTMAAIPIMGSFDGSPAGGLFLLNGAVHPAHRGRKLQSRISDAIFEEAVSQGFTFCFGTGNRYSTGPLLTRFKLVRPLEARIGVGLPHRRDTRPPSFRRLWNDRAMQWRLGNPERTYSVSRAGDRTLVSTRTFVPGLNVILYDGPQRWPCAQRGRLDVMRLWLGLDPDIDWRRSRYVPIPERLRPSPLNLVFKDLTNQSFLPDPERLAFRAVDFDPF